MRSARLAAPDLRVALLRASSVVPAASFGPAGPHAPGIFAIGSESVIPRVGETFRRSETLRLYLQVYDAALDPSTAKARLDVRFGLEDPLAVLINVCQMATGALYLAARAGGLAAGDVHSPSFEYGNTFTAVAGCLLNMLAVLDAYDVAAGRK